MERSRLISDSPGWNESEPLDARISGSPWFNQESPSFVPPCLGERTVFPDPGPDSDIDLDLDLEGRPTPVRHYPCHWGSVGARWAPCPFAQTTKARSNAGLEGVVERAAHGVARSAGDMGVDHGRLQVLVPEQALDLADVHAAFERNLTFR